LTADSADPQAPTPLRQFLEHYRAGRFWDSHEALEGAWREKGSDFYQALILYASAWVHWERGNAHGVRAQLRKASERLASYPGRYLGLDIAALREHCISVGREYTLHPHDWLDRVAPAPLDFALDRVRGDEVELSNDSRDD